MRIVHGLGRAIFGGFFLYNGINHLSNTEALEGYAAAKQVQHPHLSIKGSGILMTVAGAAMLLGLAPRFGALGVAGFLAAASPKMHDFWNVQDPGQRQAEMIQFSKNMALLGAALALAGIDSKERED
jgi:putative oxidoreductase